MRKEADNLKYSNIIKFVTEFEAGLSDEELKLQSYAYRVVYVPISVNRSNQADKAVEFIKAGSENAKNVEKVLIRGVEKPKYLPSQIVKRMNDEGYEKFSMHYHTQLWQIKDARNPRYNYGVYVAKQWYWYKNWLDVVREYCQESHS